MKNLKEDLKEIYDHFGYENQLLKLREEMAELTYEIDQRQRDPVKLMWEFVDVYILVCEILLGMSIKTLKMFKQMVKYKINRTKQRIKEGYYEEN